MTTATDKPARVLTRLGAAQALEVGKWLTENTEALSTVSRTVLAQMASDALGYSVSPSTIELQGRIRGLPTGRIHTPKPKTKESATKNGKRIAQLEKHLYKLVKILEDAATNFETRDTFNAIRYHMDNERMEAAK